MVFFCLVYRRRQHRLEQEQADIEYEIRVLMAQPECNKTDTDKSREEALISRLVEVSFSFDFFYISKFINKKFKIGIVSGCAVAK